MLLHSPASRPVISYDWIGFVSRILGVGAVAMVALAAGLVGVYTVLFMLGAMGLL